MWSSCLLYTSLGCVKEITRNAGARVLFGSYRGFAMNLEDVYKRQAPHRTLTIPRKPSSGASIRGFPDSALKRERNSTFSNLRRVSAILSDFARKVSRPGSWPWNWNRQQRPLPHTCTPKPATSITAFRTSPSTRRVSTLQWAILLSGISLSTTCLLYTSRCV